jgi:hypothetical protein
MNQPDRLDNKLNPTLGLKKVPAVNQAQVNKVRADQVILGQALVPEWEWAAPGWEWEGLIDKQ